MGGALSSKDTPIQDKHYDAYASSMVSQAGKVFAITGTTSGTGFMAARAIVTKGGKVLCLNRPSERASASLTALKEFCADGGSAEQVDCDLQSFASVRNAAATVKKQAGPTGLFALVNNAGVMALAGKATKDGYEVQMQTNHLSHFLLTALVLPALDQGAATHGEARVVNHSSGARNSPAEPLEAKYMQKYTDGVDLKDDSTEGRSKRYQQSKLANSSFTLALKDKLAAKGSKIKSLVAHPGISSTSLSSNTSSDSPGSILDSKMVQRLLRMFTQGQGDGSLPLLAATVAPEAESGDFYTPGTFGVMSMAFKDRMTGPPMKMDWAGRGDLEKNTKDPEQHKLLWECSEAATGETMLA